MNDQERIQNLIETLQQEHGCEVICEQAFSENTPGIFTVRTPKCSYRLKIIDPGFLGINNMEPAMLARVLAELPIKQAILDRDILEIETSRPLTQSEAFALAQAGADSPEEIEDEQTHFVLWWD